MEEELKRVRERQDTIGQTASPSLRGGKAARGRGHGRSDWEEFLDWMALSGVNMFLGMTGQEEVQYKVFQKFGLNDTTIRSWFNGPALLTWSRGQNEKAGRGQTGGPLPRSWMKQQWSMQKQILGRSRSLGMTAQLPGFQGNVPIELPLPNGSKIWNVNNFTGWLGSTDPLFAQIADEWMTTLIADFGTDHVYQMDGYFGLGQAPWMDSSEERQRHQNKLPTVSLLSLISLRACGGG